MNYKKINHRFVKEAQPRCYGSGWVEHGYYHNSQWYRTDRTKCPGCQDCRGRRENDGE